MLTLIPEPDGRVAIYEAGTFRCHARDAAHAEEVHARYIAGLKAAAPVLWAFGRALWDAQPQAERDRINRWVRDTYALAEQMRRREKVSPLASLGPLQQFAEMQRAEREQLARGQETETAALVAA